MEDWVKQKDLIIEQLFMLTTRLEDEVNRSDWQAMDLTLQERARVFLRLIRLDRAHQNQATEKDPLWIKQLEQIKRHGDQVYSRIREELIRIAQDFKATEDAKIRIFEEEMVSPKGTRIEKTI